MNANTLSELLQSNRGAARSITYYEGERERRVVSYAELYERALGILHHLQSSAPARATACCCSWPITRRLSTHSGPGSSAASHRSRWPRHQRRASP
jgi:hypothetical protein